MRKTSGNDLHTTTTTPQIYTQNDHQSDDQKKQTETVKQQDKNPVMVQPQPQQSPLTAPATKLPLEPVREFRLESKPADPGQSQRIGIEKNTFKASPPIRVKDNTNFDQQYEAGCVRLRAAIRSDNVQEAKSVIDWFDQNFKFDTQHVQPIEKELKNFSDQEILCLAKAGYQFSSDYFPSHCTDQTIAAMQDVMFGEGLQRSPFAKVISGPEHSAGNSWYCISLCGTLDEHGAFDAETTKAELLLQGFRKPVALFLCELLQSCSIPALKNDTSTSPLSPVQMHMTGLMMLREIDSALSDLKSADPLVQKQIRLLVNASHDSIQLFLGSHEEFFGKCMSCIEDNLVIDIGRLKKIICEQIGLPTVFWKYIGQALMSAQEQGLDMPLGQFFKPGITGREALDQIGNLKVTVRCNILRCLPKAIEQALSSSECKAELRSMAGQGGQALKIFAESSLSYLTKLCWQMNAHIEAGLSLKHFQAFKPESDFDSDADSNADSDSDSYHVHPDNVDVKASNPEADESGSGGEESDPEGESIHG